MPLVMTQVEEAPRDTRVTLVRDEFLNEYGGRLKAGTAVFVPEAVARKWLTLGIARDSAETDQTLREQKQARIKALEAELADLDKPPEPAGPLHRGRARPAVQA